MPRDGERKKEKKKEIDKKGFCFYHYCSAKQDDHHRYPKCHANKMQHRLNPTRVVVSLGFVNTCRSLEQDSSALYRATSHSGVWLLQIVVGGMRGFLVCERVSLHPYGDETTRSGRLMRLGAFRTEAAGAWPLGLVWVWA